MIKIIIIIKINIFTFRVIRIGEIIFSKVGKSVSYFIVKYRFPFTFKISFLAANIYIYIYSVLQFVGHCNFRYQVSFLMYTYYHENGARYIKKHEAIIRAIRNANIRFTGEVHQSEVFPTLVPPFSPRFTYLRHSIFPNVCVCE